MSSILTNNLDFLRNLIKGRHILFGLVKTDLTNRYRKSILGIGWTLIHPLCLTAILGVVYSIILKQEIKEFLPFLFAGLLPWLFIVGCSEGASMSFLGAEGYIKQTLAPIEIFPMRTVLVSFINLLFGLVAFFMTVIIINPGLINLNTLYVIPALGLLLLFGYASAILTSLAQLYYRDFAPICNLFFQGLFYATPILYPISLIENTQYQWIYKINPYYYLLEIVRRPLQGMEIGNSEPWIYCLGFTLLLGFVGITIFTRIGRRIVYRF